MNRTAHFLFPLSLVTLLLASSQQADAQKISDKGAHVRIFNNADGTSTVLKRDHTNTRLEQSTFKEKANGEKVIRTRTIYRRDVEGRLRSGIIEDGQKNQLYRIIYGYDKRTGRLIAENMFDARVIRKNDPIDPTKETPIRALRYSYNAQGQRSKPIVYVGIKGRTSEELKKWLKKHGNKGSTLPTVDPFKEDTVNPNAKPLNK